MRESAIVLMNQISFPFIGDRIMHEITVTMDRSKNQFKRDWFAGNALMGLRSHLQTGGFSEVLKEIDDFGREDTENLAHCLKFVETVKTKIEKSMQVKISTTDNAQKGFTYYLRKLFAPRLSNGPEVLNHYKSFPYHIEGSTLNFGAFPIIRESKARI